MSKIGISKYFYAFALTIGFEQALAETNPDQQAAKQNGIILFNQLKSTDATPFLKIAAEAGDHEAQYYLAEALRLKNNFINPEARRWYEAAAVQNDLYAMIQLSRKSDMCEIDNSCLNNESGEPNWLDKASLLAQEKIAEGDAEAMYLMFEISSKQEWLEKSASEGYPLAQYLLGMRYKEGKGFLLPWKRAALTEKLFKDSAESGYPRSMMEYGAILYEKGDIEGYRHWNEQAASAGYASTVFGYGLDLAHQPDTYGFPYDIIKGYALIYSLKELDGGGGLQTRVNNALSKIEKKMTEEQVKKAKIFAAQWKSTHPPLSFFPYKLSHY